MSSKKMNANINLPDSLNNINKNQMIYNQMNNNQNNINANMKQLSGTNEYITMMEQEDQYLNEAAKDSELNVTMYYYNFVILLVVVLFLIVLLIKFSLSVNGQKGGGERNYNGYLFLLSIMVLFLLIPYFTNFTN